MSRGSSTEGGRDPPLSRTLGSAGQPLLAGNVSAVTIAMIVVIMAIIGSAASAKKGRFREWSRGKKTDSGEIGEKRGKGKAT
jgi:hypothetical protein